ncbi:MAG: hypothetical protein ACK4FG_03665 [Brevundimonas sp.]
MVVKALGYLLLTIGVLLLVAPVVLLIWAFQMYTIGFSLDPAPLIVWALATFGSIGGGVLVLRTAKKRNPSPSGRGVE